MAKRKPEGLPYARQNRLIFHCTSGRNCKQQTLFESKVWLKDKCLKYPAEKQTFSKQQVT